MTRLPIGFFTVAWFVLVTVAAHALEIGATAPDFVGTSTKGEVRLSELRGQNVVLAVYFADFTPV